MDREIQKLLDTCSSTNDEAKKLALDGAASFSWVCARVQTQGRGRNGNSWVSDEGNLFQSVLVRNPPKDRLTWLPLIVSLAVADYLDSQDIRCMIKWPNDLYLDGRKIAGILCEGQKDFVVVGYGVNFQADPKIERSGVIGLSDLDSARVEIPKLLKSRLENCIDKIRKDYESKSLLAPGTAVTWSGKEGVVDRLGNSGELVVREGNQEVSLFSETVSLKEWG